MQKERNIKRKCRAKQGTPSKSSSHENDLQPKICFQLKPECFSSSVWFFGISVSFFFFKYYLFGFTFLRREIAKCIWAYAEWHIQRHRCQPASLYLVTLMPFRNYGRQACEFAATPVNSFSRSKLASEWWLDMVMRNKAMGSVHFVQTSVISVIFERSWRNDRVPGLAFKTFQSLQDMQDLYSLRKNWLRALSILILSQFLLLILEFRPVKKKYIGSRRSTGLTISERHLNRCYASESTSQYPFC